MAGSLTASHLDEAFAALGAMFTWHQDVEILIVGGAAGMITGALPPERTTGDCDVMRYEPAIVCTAIEAAAERVAQQLGLPPKWLNSDVQLRADALPQGWRSRRIWVGTYGRLTVYAISRLDLIGMKFLAHRPADLEDLTSLAVSREELEFVNQYLRELPAQGTPPAEIDQAREYVNAWESKP